MHAENFGDLRRKFWGLRRIYLGLRRKFGVPAPKIVGLAPKLFGPAPNYFGPAPKLRAEFFHCKNIIKMQPFGSNNPVMMNSGRLIFHILGWPRKHLFGNIWEGSLSGPRGGGKVPDWCIFEKDIVMPLKTFLRHPLDYVLGLLQTTSGQNHCKITRTAH